MIEQHEQRATAMEHGEEFEIDYIDAKLLKKRGYKLSLGLPIYATHYRKTLGHDNAMHIKYLGDKVYLHREHVNPNDNLIEHLKQDMKMKHWIAVTLSTFGVAGVVALIAKK